MRLEPGGPWIGLGLGDIDPEVDRLKDHIRRKWDRFDATVGDGPVFTQELVAIVAELQDIYRREGKLKAGEYLPGVANKKTKQKMGFIADDPPEDRRPMLFSFCGAAAQGWMGPDADAARALEPWYMWRWVGFDTRPFPNMGKGIKSGRDQFFIDANQWRARIEKYGFALLGYSMGSIAASEVYEFDIKPTTGRLHWMLKHFIGAAMFGPPMREVGNAVGDPNGAPPAANTGGVTEVLMRDTPATWINIAHAGDLYTEVDDGESGENKRAIFMIIRSFSIGSFFKGVDSIASQVMEILGVKKDAGKIAEIYGAVKAMWDAGMFLGRGLTPHTNYVPAVAVEHLRRLRP